MPSIDLNSDLGESFGRYTLGLDDQVIPLVSSVNVACGMHAGDPAVMRRPVKLAADAGVAVGAHPGSPDLQGFGRHNVYNALAAASAAWVMGVDGAQCTPHMPVNVQELGADFFAFSGHKVFGPMGIGGLYGREDLLEEMPPFLSGGEMIESVTRTGAVYAELPHKFEAGTVNAAGAAGLAAAIRYVQSVGFDTIQQREHDLTANALARVLAVPHVHVLGTDRPEDHNGIITFTVDGVHPHDISEIMASDGVNIRAGHHCAQPLLAHLGLNATARASFAFYNTDEDVDRFLESLSTLRERMGYGK